MAAIQVTPHWQLVERIDSLALALEHAQAHHSNDVTLLMWGLILMAIIQVIDR